MISSLVVSVPETNFSPEQAAIDTLCSRSSELGWSESDQFFPFPSLTSLVLPSSQISVGDNLSGAHVSLHIAALHPPSSR